MVILVRPHWPRQSPFTISSMTQSRGANEATTTSSHAEAIS